ncbi:translocation/assembly module TamB domain-containing protein [Rariglobus hedericola]|uniref:Translocation and assembly module TamB C-terminal domain-containing protein n=1 Tax=Rariglobus hedericola TaxID=2597822 RepID=A0A556QP96_9BACT|nr:translocation/assembly module TamB domain-containing protein [Rariglobus hedericola]TSJ78466.1 hypothetical protein FPL22_03970 [Rariglobus hedericola]
MRRKLVLITLSVVACALLALVSLPWWLGAALNVVGGHYGVTFGEYRRVGYTRFELENVDVKVASVEVKASRVQLGTPLVWLAGRPGNVVIDDWSVDVTASKTPSKNPKPPRGWLVLRKLLGRIVDKLDTWLPPATARNGSVTWPGSRLDFSNVTWTKNELQVASLRWKQLDAAVGLKCDVAGDRWVLDVREQAGHWTADAVSTGAEIAVKGNWFDQPWTVAAQFAPTGWLPLEAQAKASQWTVPGNRAKLGAYYATVSGNGVVVWKDKTLSVELDAAGVPVDGKEVPPLQVKLQGSGQADRLTIDHLEVAMPGVTGQLSEPIEIGRDGQLFSGASRFELTADLAKQPWFKGRGRVTGSVNVTPRDTGIPLVEAVLTTVDAAIADWGTTQADVAVRVEWPQVQVSKASIRLVGGDQLALSGGWNADTHTLIDARLDGQISRATAARWLPEDAGFDTFDIKATAGGVWPAITHRGQVNAQALRVSPVRPLSVQGSWTGTGATIDEAKLNATASQTSVRLVASGNASAVKVSELVLAQSGEDRLRLMQPVRIARLPAWTVEPVIFKGPRGSIEGQLALGETGRITLNVQNFASSWIIDLLELKGPEWSVAALAVQGDWDRGPLRFTTTGAGRMQLNEGRSAEVALSAHGDGEGVVLDTLSATMDQQPVVSATGRLPVAVWPAQKPLLRFDDSAPLVLDAVTEPHALFWNEITSITGLVLTRPEVNLKIAGTLKKPTGEGSISIEKIAPGGAVWARSLPEIQSVKARLTGAREGLALESFNARVAGQEVRASGRLPVKDWAVLISDPLSLAEADGEARIEIPDADVAALAALAPAYLSPAGKLQIDISLKKGGQLQGFVKLKDAATRPLGPLGILQSISADIQLNGRTVTFTQVRASAGGQPVTLSGSVDLTDTKIPRLNLALRGEKLPFVRQAGLLVRGDIDLRIITDADGVTRITGNSKLGDSLFLMDVRSLLPSGGPRNAPGRRPPYFAVTIPPFNAWEIDVAVDGDRFLRLRTPVFNGVVSAHFRLRGTLGDPRATGDAIINQGQVMLPFATFVVRQGSVRIAESAPFEPRISLVGTSRRYGYDLRMEISGTTEKPQITFFSTPTLESEQVLLMVMAGETPQNEINYTGRERAARLGTYLGQSLLNQLGSDPAAADKLTIDVGERVSEQGRETYGISYELSPRWSLVGEYDEYDEYNLGVKWRIFSEKREDKPTDAKK